MRARKKETIRRKLGVSFVKMQQRGSYESSTIAFLGQNLNPQSSPGSKNEVPCYQASRILD